MDAKEVEDVDVSGVRAPQCCLKCFEWEERFTELKLEFERKMSDKKIESLKVEDEQKVTPVADYTGDVEDDRIMDLMIENRVLECEKKKAETDVQVWKSKCEELERRVKELERGSGVSEIGREETNAATPVSDTFRNLTPLKEGEGGNRRKSKLECGSRARTQLIFGEEISAKNIAGVGPASPAVVDIIDSDEEAVALNGVSEKVDLSMNMCDEEDLVFHKRKRAFPSDSESDREGHLPSSRSLRSNSDEDGKPVTRRRLVRLRNSKASGISKESSPSHLKSTKTDKSSSDEDESDSEGESLDGFIVNDSDISDTENTSKDGSFSGDAVSESGDDSDSDTNYGNIIARIGRSNGHKWDWEFLADMQAAFGKDPELCMRAVCALYRKQTTDEKYYKATVHRNGQGFSQCDAYSGSKLGEFLTDGDPDGDLIKSVEELEKYDPRGVEKCRKLALHYSYQLFNSYQSGEDPLWLPSESKRPVIKPDDNKVKLPSGDICSTQPPESNHSEPQDDEDNITCQNVSAPSSVKKRKRASTVFDSDSESDSEDNIPISQLKKESKMDEDDKPRVRKRRLAKLRNLKPSHIKCEKIEHSTDKNREDAESETEGDESWDDFINDNSDTSVSKDDHS